MRAWSFRFKVGQWGRRTSRTLCARLARHALGVSDAGCGSNAPAWPRIELGSCAWAAGGNMEASESRANQDTAWTLTQRRRRIAKADRCSGWTGVGVGGRFRQEAAPSGACPVRAPLAYQRRRHVAGRPAAQASHGRGRAYMSACTGRADTGDPLSPLYRLLPTARTSRRARRTRPRSR